MKHLINRLDSKNIIEKLYGRFVQFQDLGVTHPYCYAPMGRAIKLNRDNITFITFDFIEVFNQ